MTQEHAALLLATGFILMLIAIIAVLKRRIWRLESELVDWTHPEFGTYWVDVGILKEALDFYADKEPWISDRKWPQWDHETGSPIIRDMGLRARLAIEVYENRQQPPEPDDHD